MELDDLLCSRNASSLTQQAGLSIRKTCLFLCISSFVNSCCSCGAMLESVLLFEVSAIHCQHE